MSSFSAQILQMDELINFEYPHCSCLAMQKPSCSGTINAFCDTIDWSCSSCTSSTRLRRLLLWESILRIKLHLSSTIERDGSLVEFPARPHRSFLRVIHSIRSFNSTQLDDLDSTLSSVNVGQTLKSLLLTSLTR